MIDPLTFVLCIENNAISRQALLLCESIRQFGGRHRLRADPRGGARRGLGIDAGRAAASAMNVEYVEEPLNQLCPQYGSANRVFTAAWAEERAGSEWIVVLDSDTLVLGEMELPVDADVAVRPVDTKGSATDRSRRSVRRLLAAAGGDTGRAARLPAVRPHHRPRHRVRASYNGGLVVVRREKASCGPGPSLFSRSVLAGLKPWQGSNLNVHASTGLVGLEASEYLGIEPGRGALAIWSTTRRVLHYPDTYNVPLPFLLRQPELAASGRPHRSSTSTTTRCLGRTIASRH